MNSSCTPPVSDCLGVSLVRSVGALLFGVLLLQSVSAAPAAIPTTSVTASASSSFLPPLTDPSLTCDGSGLTGDLHDNHPQGHTMWLSVANGGGSAANNPAGIAGTAWLRYTLDRVCALSEMWVWNHNQQNLTDRGLRNVTIHWSRDGVQWNLLGSRQLAQATGQPGYAHADTVPFGGVEARHILITAAASAGNYGSTYYGLSEVRFHGEPVAPPPAPVRVLSVTPDASLTAMLAPRASGWIGSDVAHSIPLGNGKSAWLFGDTFIGSVANGVRQAGAAFINNTIGIQDTAIPPPAGMTFFWGAGPSSFFPYQPGTPGNFYWPTNGVMLDGNLFLFAYSVISGLNLANTTMIRVTNPLAPPASWVWTAQDFGIGNGKGFHSAIHAEGDHVYFLGYASASGVNHATLARMQRSQLAGGELGGSLEYWTNTGTGPAWSASSASLVPLFAPANTESGIHHEPSWGLYFTCIYTPASPAIYITCAPALTGPWSDPIHVYDVPEHQLVSFDIWSYAVRPHPELSTAVGELVITYATNSVGTVAPLFTAEGLQIYAPKAVRVQLELNASGMHDWALYD